MRRKFILLILTVVVGLLSCNAQSKNTSELTKKEFLQKVWNFETSPKAFKYLGNKPAIIDFHAVWCGPCKKLNPILEELALKYKNKVIFYKIDVDKEKELAQGFGIQSIPTILFIPRKGEPSLSAGLLSKEDLIKIIEEQLIK
jgi:thioredoxin